MYETAHALILYAFTLENIVRADIEKRYQQKRNAKKARMFQLH